MTGVHIIKSILIGILILGAAGYAVFELRWVILGPQLRFTTPSRGALLSDSFVTISGTAQNISALTMNDDPIFIDEAGVFEEAYILGEGYNVIEFEAKDRFGRTRTQALELVYRPQ